MRKESVLLERFMENCKKPGGRFGRLVLKGMNCGHGAVANWAFDRLSCGRHWNGRALYRLNFISEACGLQR